MSFIFFYFHLIQVRPVYPQISLMCHAPAILQVSPTMNLSILPLLFFLPYMLLYAFSSWQYPTPLSKSSSNTTFSVKLFLIHPDRINHTFCVPIPWSRVNRWKLWTRKISFPILVILLTVTLGTTLKISEPHSPYLQSGYRVVIKIVIMYMKCLA